MITYLLFVIVYFNVGNVAIATQSEVCVHKQYLVLSSAIFQYKRTNLKKIHIYFKTVQYYYNIFK